MHNIKLHKNMLALLAVALPVVIVKLVTMGLGQSTATIAQAAPQPVAVETSSTIAAKPQPLTAKQIAAIQHIETLRRSSFGRAPLLFDETIVATPIIADTTTNNDTNTGPDPVPAFTLNAVMATAANQRALINNQPYRVGDVIKGTSWKVESIDAPGRSVTLGDTRSNRSIIVAVESPM